MKGSLMKHFRLRIAILTFAILMASFLALPPVACADEPCLLTGDFNHSSGIDPLDAVGFVDWLWRGGPGPVVLAEADNDCDCEVTPLDAMYIIDFLWRYGPAPCNSCELECWQPEGCCVLRGDFDHDGDVNETDIQLLYNWLTGVWPCVDPVCCDEIDVDGNGDIGLLDLIYLQDYVLRGGPAPPPCGGVANPPDWCWKCLIE